MDTVGNILRVERLRQGLSLEQIAEQTRINEPFLEAIETNRFDRLPRGLFTRSFIRQYAHTLNLDEEQVIASFKEHFEEPILPLPVPFKPSTRSLGRTCAWLLITVVLSDAGYSLWRSVRPSSPDTKTTSVHKVQTHPDLKALATDRVQPSLHASKAGPSLSVSGIEAVQVVFSAKEPVWISVESDGKRVFRGTLAEQESKELKASVRMIALVGNAGGLDVMLNGKLIGSLGQHGQVRFLELTPSHAHIIDRLEEGG